MRYTQIAGGCCFGGLLERQRRARSACVLTGAGMSAESGLPPSPEGFARDPRTVWRWYNERILAYRDAQPIAGHYALAN